MIVALGFVNAGRSIDGRHVEVSSARVNSQSFFANTTTIANGGRLIVDSLTTTTTTITNNPPLVVEAL